MAGADVLEMIRDQVIASTIADLEYGPPPLLPGEVKPYGPDRAITAERLDLLAPGEEPADECAEVLGLLDREEVPLPFDMTGLSRKNRELAEAVYAWHLEHPDEKFNCAAFCRATKRKYEATYRMWEKLKPILRSWRRA